jgi:hypothetical protein
LSCAADWLPTPNDSLENKPTGAMFNHPGVIYAQSASDVWIRHRLLCSAASTSRLQLTRGNARRAQPPQHATGIGRQSALPVACCGICAHAVISHQRNTRDCERSKKMGLLSTFRKTLPWLSWDTFNRFTSAAPPSRAAGCGLLSAGHAGLSRWRILWPWRQRASPPPGMLRSLPWDYRAGTDAEHPSPPQS